MQSIADGVWSWTAPHPDWKPGDGGPGGWERVVTSYCVEPAGPGGPFVLFDPLVPPDGVEGAEGLWERLEAVRAGRAPTVLIGNHWHARSADRIRERLAGSADVAVLCASAARPRAECEVSAEIGAGAALPEGTRTREIAGLHPGELVAWFPQRRALAFSDSLIGVGPGRVRLPRASWCPDPDRHPEVRSALRELLDLDFDVLLVTHGEPVPSGGRRALEEALDAPAWGDEPG